MRAIAGMAAALVAATFVAGCRTSNADAWSGGATTAFSNAESSCEEQTGFVSQEGEKRPFFIECMAAHGWTPRAGMPLILPID